MQVTDWTDGGDPDNQADGVGTIANFKGYNFQTFALADINRDSQLDYIGVNATSIVVITTTTTNQNPSFIGTGVQSNTGVPVCVNTTVTFYARQDLDYTDPEGDSAYLGVDCYGLGLVNVTWGKIAQDPTVQCHYDSIGYWNTKFYITDFANYPDYNNSHTLGMYTSYSDSCHEAGEMSEGSEPDTVGGLDVTTDQCYNDRGISVCILSGTESALCDLCNCSYVTGNRCNYVNGTRVDNYQGTTFDWDECDDWEGKFLYPICPLWIWFVGFMEDIWAWIFGTFFVVLTILLIVVIVVMVRRNKGR
jgi:hypothetical protein